LFIYCGNPSITWRIFNVINRIQVGWFFWNKCWFCCIVYRGWAILKMFEWWIQYHPGLGRDRSEIHPRDRNRFPKIDQWAVLAPHTSGTLGPRHVCAQRSNASYVTDWFYVKERLYNGVDVWCRRGKWLENNESKAPAIHCRALCPIRAIFYRFAALRFHDLKPTSLKTTDAETWNPGLHFWKM